MEILLFSTVAVVAYMLPALVAILRHHHQRDAITVLNFLLGWTVLGWVGALVWACTAIRPHEGGRLTSS